MTKSVTKPALSLAALGAVLALLQGTPAEANNVSFVSNTGSDGNDCTSVATACASLFQAVKQTAAGGEVIVVNAGSYGPQGINDTIFIVNSMSITGDYAGEARIVSGTQAIIIQAGAGDVVSLRGLVIEGFGPQGITGIQIERASAVHIQNCVIRNFQDTFSSSFGIEFVPNANSQLFVSDTIIYNNGTTSLTGGILVEPQAAIRADVVLDRVHWKTTSTVSSSTAPPHPDPAPT